MTSTAQSRNRSGSISTWYTSSYGNISRTSRLRAPAFMPAGLNNSDAMTADVTIPLDVGVSAAGMRGYGQPNAQNDNANAANGATSGTTKSKSKGGKKGETLFGPDLGLDENDSEGWVNRDLSKEKVPLSVVKDWVEKAKKEEQGVHQTTTLQALVNLKRPTLTLIPVPQDEIVPAEAETNDPAASRSSIDRRSAIRHTLRFVYDASSSRVKISISVHPQFSNHGQSRTIYTCIRDGGYGKRWELPHENALDIGQAMEDEKRAEEEMLISLKKLDGDASDASDNEDDLKKPSYAQQQDEQTIQPHVDQLSNEQVIDHASQPPRPRTLMERLRRQRRTNDVETGILADIRRQQGGEAIEMRTAGIENVIHGNNSSSAKPQSQEQGGDVKNEEGMRIVIRLDGLDEDGSNLAVTNAQSTHVLLTGTTMGGPASASRAAVAVTEQESGERLGDVQEETAAEEEEIAGSELKRVWYIKVMRREAIIGQHAFLLKEIYGLASTSGNDAPTEDQVENNDDPLASTPNECIVCLTNPRDVVLLPCRHLVVCRECALGMIEFGAGGKVARREDAAEPIADVPAAGDAPTATTLGGDLAVNPTPTVPTTTPRERRKKKAKGWFCPVCRQPYTSLLRLALPANEMTTVDIDAVTSTALSRQPSIGALSVRSTGRSLHRSTSRATLPERGERMLQDIVRDHENDEADDNVEADGQHNQGVPQFIYGQQGNLLGRTPSNAENGVVLGTALPVSISDGRQSSEAQGRSSLEGRGWRQAV